MIRNSAQTWGWPAKLLHWVAAIAIIILLGHGWWMTHMTPRPERLVNYAWHSAIGYDLLVLTAVRLLWRWSNVVPELPKDAPTVEKFAAHLGHAAIYVGIFAVSITGWMVATTFRAPMTRDLFGIQIPALVSDVARSTRNLVEGSHLVLAYILALLVALHVMAAFRHHVFKKNDVMTRMLWG